MNVDRKVVLISGGARGIAKAVALDLATGGWAVAICYRTSAHEANEVVDGVSRKAALVLASNAMYPRPKRRWH